MKKSLIICVDGLGFDRLNEKNSPFLSEFAKKNSIARLKTFFAFTGIEHSFLSGQSPAKSNIWLEFSKEDSIFKSKLLSLFSWNKRLRDYCAVFLQIIHNRGWLSGLHNIPNKFLKYFDTSMKRGLWELELFKDKNFVLYKWPLFVCSNGKKIKKRIILKNEDDEEKLGRIIEKNNFDLYYTQLLSIDKTMHKYGKYSSEADEAIKKIDRILEKKVSDFLLKNPSAEIILWSDHGFCDIKKYINLEKKLPKTKDYIYFLGGTTVSFWFFNDRIKKEIEKILNGFKEIKILNKEDAKKYSILLSEKNGELIAYLEKGNYFFPNFYQKTEKEKFKAMHGYPDDKELDGFFINNLKIKKELKLNEVLEKIK